MNVSEQAASGSDQRGVEGSSLDLCPALILGSGITGGNVEDCRSVRRFCQER